MTSIQEFIRTGELGPVMLGSPTFDLMDVLGDPDEVSEKSNPLIAIYGDLSLVFWKPKGGQKQALREFTLSLVSNTPRLPASISISDWPRFAAPTVGWLNSLGASHAAKLVARGHTGKRFIFPSGVIANTEGALVNSLTMAEKETQSQPAIEIFREDDSSELAIDDLISEAKKVAIIGANRSALLIGWSAIEALLRRLTRRLHSTDLSPAQPHLLLKRLKSENILSAANYSSLEYLRQLRTHIAHGVKPRDVTSQDIQLLFFLVQEIKSEINNTN